MAHSRPVQPNVIIRDAQIIGAFTIGDTVLHGTNRGVIIDRHDGGSYLVRHDRTEECYWAPARALTLER